jgi:hypothetical protein
VANVDVINYSLILSVITKELNLEKIEIIPKKGKAILKNENRSLTIESVNPLAIKNSVENLSLPQFVKINDEEYQDSDPYPSLGFFLKYEDLRKQRVLSGNKLQVAELYHKYLSLEESLSVTAPFYDVTSGIKKIDYHKNLIKYLKELTLIRRKEVIQFDVSKVKGALSMEVYQHPESETEIEVEEISLDVQNQLVHLRKVPQLSSELRASQHQNIEPTEATSIFSSLMSTCYQSIYKVDIASYHSEIARRMSLRSLFKFQQAYIYMKEWVMKFASRSKGTKSSTQVRTLLTGKNTIKNLLGIDQATSESFQIQNVREASQSSKKRKRSTIETNPTDLIINIPGFSGKISSRKLSTFIAAGPRLMELLQTLNNNWVTLDLIDEVTITWLENFRKKEWNEFIKKINRLPIAI